jgi:hypothetical protein
MLLHLYTIESDKWRSAMTYNYVVEFEKLLTKGVLNGLTVKDRLHFMSEKDAKTWVKDVQNMDKGSKFVSFSIKQVA